MNPEAIKFTSEGKEQKEPRKVFLEVGIKADWWFDDKGDKLLPVSSGGERKWRPEEVYIGIELSTKNLKETRELIKHEQTPPKVTPDKCFFVQGDAQRVPLRDGSVDTIFFGNIFGDPDIKAKAKENFLEEARRILRKNGEIIILETRTPEIAKTGGMTHFRGSSLEHWGEIGPEIADLLKEAGFIESALIDASNPQWAEEVGKYSNKARELIQRSFFPDEIPFLIRAMVESKKKSKKKQVDN